MLKVRCENRTFGSHYIELRPMDGMILLISTINLIQDHFGYRQLNIGLNKGVGL